MPRDLSYESREQRNTKVANRVCPKCNGSMKVGFSVDRVEAGAAVLEWIEGVKLRQIALIEPPAALEGAWSEAGKALRLKIPVLTQNGQVFRLKGHGMPVTGKPEEHGDLYATVNVELPKSLTPEQRTHFEALQKL